MQAKYKTFHKNNWQRFCSPGKQKETAKYSLVETLIEQSQNLPTFFISRKQYKYINSLCDIFSLTLNFAIYLETSLIVCNSFELVFFFFLMSGYSLPFNSGNAGC